MTIESTLNAPGTRTTRARKSGPASGVRSRTLPAPMLTSEAFLALAAPARNPQGDAIERLSADVAERTGLLRPDNRARFSAFNTLVPYVHPEASVERAVTCALWCNWLFFFDDVHDEDADAIDDLRGVHDRMAHYLRLLSGAPLPRDATPLERLTGEVHRRLRALGGDEWLGRFCRSASDYLFFGALPAVRNWQSGRVPGLEEYMFQREHDSAVLTTLDLIEVADGVTLPPEVLWSPELSRARSACARTTAFFNDIVSYPKEVLQHKNPNNLVHVLMRERGIDLREAMLDAAEITNQAAHEQLRLSNRIASSLPPGPHPVRTYLNGMRAWQRGNIDFSLDGGRYAAPWSPLVELATGVRQERRSAA